jgi:hypothetical protein
MGADPNDVRPSRIYSRETAMRIPSSAKTPGAIVALVGLVSILVLFVVLAVELPVPGGGLPAWSYWWFGASALLWIWGIAWAIPRPFRVWALAYAVLVTPLFVVATAFLAAQGHS